MPHPESIIYTAHASKRMRERAIMRSDVKAVLREGERIENYPDDPRGASYLLLGWTHREPLHIQVAKSGDQTVVVTTYWPDPDLWSDDFRERL